MAEIVRKNLGMVTAYAYAVSKGYTGTEEEFAELMASYADVAQDAEASAQAAAQSATTAEQKATQAAGSATNAAESADDAEASAQMAAGSSNSASLYAQNASASATNAAGSASSASTHAGNASASAQAAEGSANAARASATQAAGSADDAEAAKDVILGMNAVAETLPAGSQATASYSNGTLTLGIPKGDTGEKGDAGDTNDAPVIINSASGPIASFTDGADDLPMKSCVVNIEPIQEGEGDPSPENVRPISGRTGLTVVRCGKNLLPPKKYQYTTTQVRLGGETVSEAYFILKAGTYTLTIEADVSVIAYYTIKNGQTITIGNNGGSFTITDDKEIVIYCYKASGLSADSVIRWQLETGSAATAYEPYKENTYIVNWETEAGTVYGGTLDVISGKLRMDGVLRTLNGSENWRSSDSTTNSYWFLKVENFNVGINESAISDHFPKSGAILASNQNEGIYSVNSSAYNAFNVYIRWYALNVTTVAEFKEWLSSNNVTISYKLTTPTEIQLTPQEIRTLLGENNVWSDAGSIAVEYPTDTKMYIDQKITEAIAAVLA